MLTRFILGVLGVILVYVIGMIIYFGRDIEPTYTITNPNMDTYRTTHVIDGESYTLIEPVYSYTELPTRDKKPGCVKLTAHCSTENSRLFKQLGFFIRLADGADTTVILGLQAPDLTATWLIDTDRHSTYRHTDNSAVGTYQGIRRMSAPLWTLEMSDMAGQIHGPIGRKHFKLTVQDGVSNGLDYSELGLRGTIIQVGIAYLPDRFLDCPFYTFEIRKDWLTKD